MFKAATIGHNDATVAIVHDGFAYIAYYEEDDFNNEGRLKLAHQEFVDPVFSDDFESGDVSAWSSSAGPPMDVAFLS